MNKYFFVIFVVLLSCKKEDVKKDYQTIYPQSYLPVYPGSTWQYTDETGDTIIYKTDDNYILNSYSSYTLYGNATDPAYVPYWNGNPVYGYSTPLQTSSPSNNEDYARGMKQVGYLSETKGEQWVIYASQYGAAWRTVVNIDTTIIVNSYSFNHVIVVNDSASFMFNSSHLTKTDYYAKDVGLIKQDINDTVVYQHLGIIGYLINH
jgi:hypothetical protein